MCYNVQMDNACNPQNRLIMVGKKVKEEDNREALATKDARDIIAEELALKGFFPSDLKKDKTYTVTAGNITQNVTADYVITLAGKSYAAIKCAMTLVSRERHVLAFARCVEETPMPYAIITDGLRAHVLDTATGEVVSESMDDLPKRSDALARMQSAELPAPLEPARHERECRILLAFESTVCPTPQTPDAGGAHE